MKGLISNFAVICLCFFLLAFVCACDMGKETKANELINENNVIVLITIVSGLITIIIAVFAILKYVNFSLIKFKNNLSNAQKEIKSAKILGEENIEKIVGNFRKVSYKKLSGLDDTIEKKLTKLYDKYINFTDFSKPMQRDAELFALIRTLMENPDDNNLKGTFLKGISAMQLSDYKEAVKQFNFSSVEQGGDKEKKYFYKALAYGRLAEAEKDHKRKFEFYQQAYDDFTLVINNESCIRANAFNGRGFYRLKWSKRQLKCAQNDFIKAIKTKPNYWLAYINFVETLILEKKYKLALEEIDSIIPRLVKSNENIEDYKAILLFFKLATIILPHKSETLSRSKEKVEKLEQQFLLQLNKIRNQRTWNYIRFDEWLNVTPFIDKKVKALLIKNQSFLNANRRIGY